MATQPVAADLLSACVADLRARSEDSTAALPALDIVADLEREQRLERDGETARRFRNLLLARDDHADLSGHLDGRSQSYLARLAMLLVRQAHTDRPAPPRPQLRLLLALASASDQRIYPGGVTPNAARSESPPPRWAARLILMLLTAPCAPPARAHVLGVTA